MATLGCLRINIVSCKWAPIIFDLISDINVPLYDYKFTFSPTKLFLIILNDKSKFYLLFFKQGVLNFENHTVYNKYIVKFCGNLNFFVHKISKVEQG